MLLETRYSSGVAPLGPLFRSLASWRDFAIMLCIGCASLLGGTAANAGSASANLTVQITITASCTINVATLNFGASVAGTALQAGATNGSTTVSTTCTNSSPYAIGLDNGANASSGQRRMKSGTNYINYNLYTDSGYANAWTTAASSTTCTTANSCALGTGTGSAQTTTIYGQIPTVAVAPVPGAYSDTVSMTITY
jgi:spore coat protein U-like protein